MKQEWTTEELTAQWQLLPADLTLLANKKGPTRLGFAVLLKFFELEGRFPHYRDEVPAIVVRELARQVGVLPNTIAIMIGTVRPSSTIAVRFAPTVALGGYRCRSAGIDHVAQRADGRLF